MLNISGFVLGLSGVVFVGQRLFAYRAELDAAILAPGDYAVMVLLALIYGGFAVLLALGWRTILAALGQPVSARWAYQVYAVSQLAKYVPGNIFQFAGRQALGAAAGIGHAQLAKSTVIELASQAAIGVLFLPFAVTLLASPHMPFSGSASLFIVGFVVLLGVARWMAEQHGARILLCYLVFQVVAGIAFAIVLARTADFQPAAQDLVLIVSAYILAWLAGLLTPGAPAGIGVRETVLLLLLSGMAPQADILIAVLAGRMVTIGGDLIFFLLGSALHTRSHKVVQGGQISDDPG